MGTAGLSVSKKSAYYVINICKTSKNFQDVCGFYWFDKIRIICKICLYCYLQKSPYGLKMYC